MKLLLYYVAYEELDNGLGTPACTEELPIWPDTSSRYSHLEAKSGLLVLQNVLTTAFQSLTRISKRPLQNVDIPHSFSAKVHLNSYPES